jgi:hypothetical protein
MVLLGLTNFERPTIYNDSLEDFLKPCILAF